MSKEIIIPKPFEMIFTPKRYKVWKGGRGGAKSESIARGLLIKARKKKHRILCTREFQASIKESVYKLLVSLIDKYKLNGFTVTIDSIRHRNGSEFLFKGLKNNIDSIKSMHDIDICWVEEAHTISKESLDILLPTIRADGSEIWFSYNPEDDDDPVTIQFPESDEYTFVRHVNYDENPFFPSVLDDERKRCFKNKPDDYGHIWDGLPSNQYNGSVVKNFTDANIKPITYQPDIPLHITTDFNVDPMCWHLAHLDWETEDKVRGYYFFDEIVLENTTTVKTIDEFHYRMIEYGNGKANLDQQIIINGDSSGDNRSTQSEYANYALMLNRLSALGYSDVSIKLRTSNGYKINRNAAWNEKVIDLDGKRGIIVDPKCVKLLYNIKHLKYKEGTRTIDEPTPAMIKKNPKLKFLVHPYDDASYLVNTYSPIKVEN